MRIANIIRNTAAIGFALILAACSGGGGGAAPTPGPGVSKGVITQLGSITVNGVKFQVAGAKLRMPDDNRGKDNPMEIQAEQQNELKEGMVVTVKGEFNGNNGIAREIEFRDDLQGMITSKGADFITVLGLTVLIDDATKIFDKNKIPITFAALVVGDRVKVSGLPNDKGQVMATFIQKKDDLQPQAEQELKGFVIGTPTATTFQLGTTPTATSTITVNFSGITLPAGITNGVFVEVKSVVGFNAQNELVASRVEIEDELVKEMENEQFEVEGFVVSGTVDSFVIGDLTVQTNAQTLFVGGTRDDFAVGMKVEVEGNLVNGVFIAAKVVFKASIRINANVTAVDTTAGTFTLLTKTILVTSATDLRGLNGNPFILDTTLVNSNVEVRGFLNTTGSIVAARVDIKNAAPATDVFLRGPVTAKSPPFLTIAGIQVDTTGAQLEGEDDVVINDAAAFFNAITVNATVVKVSWRNFTSTSVPVREAELED